MGDHGLHVLESKSFASLTPTRMGRYEILHEIASGGMATVHLARTVAAAGFERIVAIKACHAHLRRDQDFVTMFLDEARLAARIHHPNVVATLDVGQDADGSMYLVMEYIEGGTLLNLLKSAQRRGARIPLDIALKIATELLAGLNCAHELADDNGVPLAIVHRDVSPPNILVGAVGVTRITDFGIAKASERLSHTREGHLKGKLAYMSPEQFNEGHLTRRADVFSAGIVLWEVLAGRHLFASQSDAATVKKLLGTRADPPSSVVPEIPRAVDALILKALASNPDDRFATASEFAEAIEVSGVPIASTRHVAAYVESMLGDVLEDRRALIRSFHITEVASRAERPALAISLSSNAKPVLRSAEITEPAGPMKSGARAITLSKSPPDAHATKHETARRRLRHVATALVVIAGVLAATVVASHPGQRTAGLSPFASPSLSPTPSVLPESGPSRLPTTRLQTLTPEGSASVLPTQEPQHVLASPTPLQAAAVHAQTSRRPSAARTRRQHAGPYEPPGL